MLSAVIVNVVPTEETTAPPNTGLAIQAWFLNLIRAHDPRLSAALHEGSGPRPYTIGDVVGLGPAREGRRLLSPERPGRLRITTLTPELSDMLTRRIAPMLPGAVIDLDRAFLRVESVIANPEEHPWAGQTTPEALITAGSLSPEMPRHLLMNFALPTAFKSEGNYIPFPTPAHVFGSLLDRWNAFSAVSLHPDTRRFAEAKIVVNRYRLRTRYLSFGGADRAPAVGCVGQCRYYILSADRYWIGIARTLAAYAFWAGVGARTGIGMGQAALWDEQAGRPVSPAISQVAEH
ncbi:MAG: CRISPR system precrRNA processing endoribonuclease RAMP protein Cas6 [Anaerolineae bacterium]|nr:CRISPR system precrRNA processing endoribonuclease RAMP protein Cas6 [Anaerolineae bacterium]